MRAAGEADGRPAAGGARDRQRGRRLPRHGRLRLGRGLPHGAPQDSQAAQQQGKSTYLYDSVVDVAFQPPSLRGSFHEKSSR